MLVDFPNIFEWLERAAPLQGFPAATIVLLAAAVVVAIWDWRVALFALVVQYLAGGLLFADLLDPRLAFVKFLAGMFICLMLYMTARQVEWGRQPADLSPAEQSRLHPRRTVAIWRFTLPALHLLHLVLVVAVVFLVFVLADRPAFQLAIIPDYVSLAVLGLTALGLLGMLISGEPMKAGMSFLLFMTGFELLYNTLDQTVVMLILLAVANMAFTLTIAYLTQLRYAPPVALDEA
jgi:hypothetical protein